MIIEVKKWHLSVTKVTSIYNTKVCRMEAKKKILKFQTQSLRKKCRYSKLFWSECGKIRTRITPNMDTFDAVSIFVSLKRFY